MRMLDLGPGTHWSWRVFTVRLRGVCFSKLVMCQIARPFVTVFDSAQRFVSLYQYYHGKEHCNSCSAVYIFHKIVSPYQWSSFGVCKALSTYEGSFPLTSGKWNVDVIKNLWHNFFINSYIHPPLAPCNIGVAKSNEPPKDTLLPWRR